jgi:hypothetical protein
MPLSVRRILGAVVISLLARKAGGRIFKLSIIFNQNLEANDLRILIVDALK